MKTENVDLSEIIIDPEFNLDLSNRTKNDCYVNRNYCFDTDDCISACDDGFSFNCIAGMCIGMDIIQSQVINECNPITGQMGFLVGDPQLGRYNTICKSIDPGVAPNNPDDENRICMKGTISIDYRKNFPAINQCNCGSKEQIVLPATSMVREVSACVSSDLANYFQLK